LLSCSRIARSTACSDISTPLYPAGQGFNGLSDGTFTNPVPPFINGGHTFVTARPSPGTDADMQNPNPDPGEPYPRINTQLFGIVNPATNQFEAATQMPPYNAPPAGTTPTMQGFVQDYCNTFVQLQGRKPTFDEYRVIMDTFTAAQLSVLSTLAQSFAVYDAWFCAVPSQTICNRSFFHASTSSGYVLNVPYSKWIETNVAPTIFNRLQDAGRTWCVYFDPTQLAIHGADSCAGAVSVLENQLRHDGRLLFGRGDRKSSRLRVHRASDGVQPQRLPPARADLHRQRPDWGFVRRASSRSASASDLQRDPNQRVGARLERGEHHAARHVRRARRML
jgi:hypothetical protein